MSLFSGIIGHQPILRVLEHALQKPAHGYLFSGPRSVGKTTVAERLAAGLLGWQEIKNQKSELKNADLILDTGYSILDTFLSSHPDFIRLQREEGAREIVVKQVREVLVRMQLTSAHGGYKVALVEQAERLNEEAANALLKAVEEPSPKTVYIFITEQPDRLPATLRSRLTKVEFGRVSMKEIEEWIREKYRESSIENRVTDPIPDTRYPIFDTALVRGCPGMAFRMLQGERDEAWDAQVDWEGYVRGFLTPPLGTQLALIERFSQLCDGQSDSETAWREGLERLMRALDASFLSQPEAAVRLGRGLARAWSLVGSAISPRLALEWTLIPDQAKQGREIPRILA
jgi:shikimate kinase